MAGREPQRSISSATELTSIIATIEDQYGKVRWNLSRFLDEQYKFRAKANGVVYAAIDFAKAANSLIDWIANARGCKPADVLPRVRWSGAIRTIANVAKHGESWEDYWPGGYVFVQLVASDGNETRIFAGPSPRDIEQHLPAWGNRSWWEIWLVRHGDQTMPAVRAFQECLEDLEALISDHRVEDSPSTS